MIQPLQRWAYVFLGTASLLSTSGLLFVPAVAQTSSPSRMLVCESVNDSCAQTNARLDIVWAFDGAEGTVSSSTVPAASHLSIEKFDGDSLVVRKADQSGSTAGRTALYTGSIHGARISGTVEWSWPSHPGYPAKGVFSALFQEPTPAASDAVEQASSGPFRPTELLVCENDGPCNVAWLFNGSTGTGTWFTKSPTHATLAILRFDSDYILIRRTDTTDGISANYAGSLRGDHYAGTIIWSVPGHPGESTGRWTATVPQTSCADKAELRAAAAMRIGQYALMFKRDGEALDCYVVAAKDGDSTAQAAVGLLYYQGRGGVEKDYTKGLFWLQKAADQGVYAAQRSVAEMYTAGLGTKRDQTLAAIYTARADEQKRDMERAQAFEERAQARREEHAERAADRANQLLSSFVLGATFGLFF